MFRFLLTVLSVILDCVAWVGRIIYKLALVVFAVVVFLLRVLGNTILGIGLLILIVIACYWFLNYSKTEVNVMVNKADTVQVEAKKAVDDVKSKIKEIKK